MNVEVLDIRVLDSKVDGLRFLQADMMSSLPVEIVPSLSVSCLHALEHFGLGRYGDPLRQDGWRIGMERLAEVVATGGRLYLGVPIGKPAIEFNAQRIFHPKYIIDEAGVHGLKLIAFAYVDDAGNFQKRSAPVSAELMGDLSNMNYGCGLFLFQKN
jgi:hypothetical protein